MTHRRLRCAVPAVLWVVWVVFSAAAAVSAQTRTVTDPVGRTVRIPEEPRRVITLAPSLTEMVFALGAGHRVVGVSRYSNFPPQVQDLPKVGSYVQPDVEKIVALTPDLCLAVKDGNPREVVEKLERLGIAVYAVNPKNLQEVMETLTALGDVLQAQEEARKVRDRMERRLEEVDRRLRGVERRPRVFFQIGVTPIVSVGTETFAQELIHRAGGVNVAAGPEPYPRFSVEQVLALRPDVIVVSSMEREQVFETVRAEWMRWRGIPAVAFERIHLVPSDLFDRPGPRLADGLELLARILHPERFHGGF
uniref:Cobalamin-binding protein n=1 Tax=Desulfacinum infernum TaxID=35837 RepID=A0A832A371_9BACT